MPGDTTVAWRPVVWASLLVALVLQVMPMPESWLLWRPCWLGMVLIYWCLARPSNVGVLHGFVFGLMLDLLDGRPLGEYALIHSLLAFLTLVLYQRLRVYSIWQQALMVMLMLGIVLLLDQWLRVAMDVDVLRIQATMAAVVSGLLWPWIRTLLSTLQRRWL